MGKTKSDTSELDALVKDISVGRDKRGIVGFADDPGNTHPRSGATAATVAATVNDGNEEGAAPEKPARPFFDDALNEAELELKAKSEKLLARIIAGDGMTLTNALKELNGIQADYIKTTLDQAPARYEANEETTVKRKGFNRALYETGWLRNQIASAIVKGEE